MDVYNFTLSLICAVFVLFAIHLLLAKKEFRYLTWLLSVIIISRIGQIIIYITARGGYSAAFPYVYSIFTPLHFIAPAALYLYLCRLIDPQNQLKKLHFAHFIPVVLAIIHFFPTGIFEPNWIQIHLRIANQEQAYMPIRTGLIPAVIFSMSRVFLIIGYLGAAWFAFIKSDLIADRGSKVRIWVLFVLITASVFNLAGFLPAIFSYRNPGNTWFLLLNCALLLVMLLYILHKPKLLYGFVLVNVNVETTVVGKAKKEGGAPSIAHNNAVVKVESIGGLTVLALEALMKDKLMFLDENLQIKDLANELSVPVHQCSALINRTIGKSFRDWVNGYRITFFIDNYHSKRDIKTIEALAKEAGFKNVVTFYNAFKKETQMMPTQYFASKNTAKAL